jgi:hypothetical protein
MQTAGTTQRDSIAPLALSAARFFVAAVASSVACGQVCDTPLPASPLKQAGWSGGQAGWPAPSCTTPPPSFGFGPSVSSIDLLSNPIRERLFSPAGPGMSRPTVTPDWVSRPAPIRCEPVTPRCGCGFGGVHHCGHSRWGRGGGRRESGWTIRIDLGGCEPRRYVDRWCDDLVVRPMPVGSGWEGTTGWVWTSGTSLQVGPAAAVPGGGFGASPGGLSPSSQATLTPPPPPTLLELAAAAMSQRQPKVAVEALRREIREQGEQAETLRRLGVALAMDRRWLDAAAVMRSAYRLDAKLGTTPLDVAAVGVDDRRLRELVKGAVLAANRGKSASEWLLVAALMQAEGREELATTMAWRAAKAGLEPEIASGFGVGVREAAKEREAGFSDRK